MHQAQQNKDIKTKNTPQKKTNVFFVPNYVVQKKLSIGASNDSYETEADSIAEKVINLRPETNSEIHQANPSIQKKCEKCQEEEKLRKKPLVENISNFVQKYSLIDRVSSEKRHHQTSASNLIQKKCSKCEEEEKLRKKESFVQESTSNFSSSSVENFAPSHIENQIKSSKGSGQSLDSGTKNFMEDRFGVDFSSVRIHTDSRAASMSNELSARAFTVENDIYFNQGEYNTSSNAGKFLLAHELTHTIQQSGGNIKKLALQKTNSKKIQRSILGTIRDGASTVWDHTGGAVIRLGGRVIDWVEDRAEEIINSIAPGLLTFLRSSVWEHIRDLIARGLDAVTGGLFSRLQQEGLSGILQEFVNGIIQSLQGEISDACRSFAQVAEKIYNFISSLSRGALARLRSVFNRLSNFFSSIWNEYARPVLEAIRHFAGDAWNWIVEKARWLWNVIEPIRNAIQSAWNWIKRMFHIAWEGAGSVWDWIVEKATQAWNWIMRAIEPIRTPLMIIGGILLLLSPLGPFVIIGAAVYGIYRAVQWIRANWNNEVLVRFRNFLQQNVLSPIQQGIERLRSMVHSALQWISGLFQRLQAAFMSLVNAVTQSSIFRFLVGVVQSISNAITSVGNWLLAQSIRVGQFISNIAQRVWTLIRPIVSLVAKLIILAANPWLIPIVIGAWFWRILPDCFKPPIINFVMRVMIGVLRAMPNFAMFGETWGQVKARIINFLQEKLGASDEEKTAAVNRVAVMVSEMDLSLLSNQISAARGAPAEFEGQMEEEVLGVNLTTALPFERTSTEERMPSLQQQMQASGLSEGIHPEDAALFNRTDYTNQHIDVNSVGEFLPSSELRQSILQRAGSEDGTVEFGNSEDRSRTVHGILSEMIPATGEPSGNEEIFSANSLDTAMPNSPARPPMSHEEETEMRLQQMMNESNAQMERQGCTHSPENSSSSREAPTNAFPEEAKFGPLTRSQRARYTMNQMSSGIGHWWGCNRRWLLPTIIGVIVVVILAEILSGGAITAALPAIFSALMPIMIGVAVVRSAYYLGEYVYKSINGDIAGASRALARAFAVAAVEAIFALIGSSTFWKSLRGGISSAGNAVRTAGRTISSGARTFVRGAGRAISRVGRLGASLIGRMGGGRLLRTANAIITRGRLILQGVRGRIGRGIRTLGELAERLFSKVRFRRFRIRFTRGWFRLEGYINPWVLLATGNVTWVDEEARVGSRLGDGIVIGTNANPSRLVAAVTANPALGERLFQLLSHPRLAANSRNLISGLRAYEGLSPGRLASAVQAIETMTTNNVRGLNTFINQLGRGGRSGIGSIFTLSFLERNPTMLASLTRLEYATRSGGRVIDATINGVRFEFKNWQNISQVFRRGLVRQAMFDLQAGRDFRWVFSERILTGTITSSDALLNEIRTVLRNSGEAYFQGTHGLNRIERFIDRVFIYAESSGRIL